MEENKPLEHFQHVIRTKQTKEKNDDLWCDERQTRASKSIEGTRHGQFLLRMSVVHINSVTSQGEASNDTIISTDAPLKRLIWEEFQHRSFYCSQVDPVLSKRTFCSTKHILLLFETLNCDGSRLKNKKKRPQQNHLNSTEGIPALFL